MFLLLACTSADKDGLTGDDTGAAPAVVVSDLTVTVHPEIGSILVATWNQMGDADTWLTFGLEGEDPLSSPVVSRGAGAQEELLLGVPFDSDVTVTLHADDGVAQATDPVEARTGVLPETVPLPELEASEPDAWGATDRWLLIGMSSGGDGWVSEGFWKLILDRQGRVVWAHETPDEHRTFYLQPSADGTHIVWDEDTFWTDFDGGANSVVHRMTLDGTISSTISVPGLHHAFLDLGDDTVIWGGNVEGREILQERVGDGEAREIWDCSAYWAAQGSGEPCDGNALSWDAASETILYSSDAGNTVAEVTRDTGEVLRTFGQLEGSIPYAKGTRPFMKQHSPNWTEDGTLLLSAWTSGENAQILAREFAITEDAVTEVWSCGDGTGTTGQYAGEAHRLANGNTLLNYGEGGHLREYTTDCEEVWHLEWPYANLLGRAVFVEDLYAFVP